MKKEASPQHGSEMLDKFEIEELDDNALAATTAGDTNNMCNISCNVVAGCGGKGGSD